MMKLTATDTVLITSVKSEPLLRGDEFEISASEGEKLVARGLATLVVSASTPVSVEIPADWEAQSKAARLKLAKALWSGEGEAPSADTANDVISAEVNRRTLDAPQEAAGGLTLRELHADLMALGVDIDPAANAGELLELRDAKRSEKVA